MSILWCGGEDIDFGNGATVYVITGGGFRTDYARCGLASSGQGQAPSNSILKSTTFQGGAVTDAWLHFHLGNSIAANTNIMFCGFTNSSKASGDGLYVGVGSTTTKIRLITWNSSSQAQLAIESGNSIGNSTPHDIDIQVMSYGASATVNVYVDHSLVITFTGDVRISSLTNLDQIGIAGEGHDHRNVISEVIISTVDTRSNSLVTHYPNGTGNANQWAGAYTDIDESTLSDTDLIYTNTNAQGVQLGLSNLPSGTFAIRGAKAIARCEKTSDASVTQLKIGVRSGTTTDVDAGRVVATDTFTSYDRVMDVNPITSSAFTQAEIDALQIAFESLT